MRKRSTFNLSHYTNLSMKMGYLVPTSVMEVLPGDSLQVSSSYFMRLAPQAAPVMHPVHMQSFSFYVPTRIVCPDFADDFIAGGKDGSSDVVLPTISIAPTVGSLADYLGLPLTTTPIEVLAFIFRAYAMIWNHYFRDQDLQDEVPVSLETGLDTTTSTELLRPCWQKDYFTTARPWPQKGDAVTIPLGSTLPVLEDYREGSYISWAGSAGIAAGATKTNPVSLPDADTTAERYVGWANYEEGALPVTANHLFANYDDSGSTDRAIHITPRGQYVDLSSVTGISINHLREAFALQRFQEHRALFGSRYEDLLRYYGVRPEDARLQQPEYLGGNSATIQFSEVLQTSNSEPGSVGDMYGHGAGAMRSSRYRRFIPEHGYVISLLCVRPIPVYCQGIDRMWSKKTKEDFWQPELEHIGQQEVLSKEVYADGTAADEEVFGYQNRYDEYRRGVNRVAGEFKTTLDYWHMARIFANRPALNSDFVESNPTDRIFQASAELSDQLYVMAKHDIIAKRLMSKNGNPI